VKLKQNWKHLGSSVYESEQGARIHVSGSLIKTSNGEYINTTVMAGFYSKLYDYSRIMGYNKKRGLMLMVERMLE
jgi:hypothetical protein